MRTSRSARSLCSRYRSKFRTLYGARNWRRIFSERVRHPTGNRHFCRSPDPALVLRSDPPRRLVDRLVLSLMQLQARMNSTLRRAWHPRGMGCPACTLPGAPRCPIRGQSSQGQHPSLARISLRSHRGRHHAHRAGVTLCVSGVARLGEESSAMPAFLNGVGRSICWTEQ